MLFMSLGWSTYIRDQNVGCKYHNSLKLTNHIDFLFRGSTGTLSHHLRNSSGPPTVHYKLQTERKFVIYVATRSLKCSSQQVVYFLLLSLLLSTFDLIFFFFFLTAQQFWLLLLFCTHTIALTQWPFLKRTFLDTGNLKIECFLETLQKICYNLILQKTK